MDELWTWGTIEPMTTDGRIGVVRCFDGETLIGYYPATWITKARLREVK